MEEEVDVNNTIEEDGRNILIEETFNNVGIDDDENPLDGVFDIHVLAKAIQPLHQGSKISLLSTILLLVNLKVMNGLSKTSVTQLLRYAIYFFTFST
jgi:hypothetical protein